jgi:two-component system sensor kinase FixL
MEWRARVNPLDAYLAFSEAMPGWLYAIAGVLVALIAYIDWKVEDVSLGFLYIVPILMASATLRGWQILAFSVACGVLRELFSPVHATPGAAVRIVIGAAGFGLAGFFVSELNRKRHLTALHLGEREHQMTLRMEAEQQLRVVIDTSPLAIVTLDSLGRILLANESAQQILGIDAQHLHGSHINAHLPILNRFLNMPDSSLNLRTTVESRAQRADGDAFLAHVWLSTFATPSGRHLAAFIWDASENLRDRERTGLDSMMATSRILIGAMSHEIRNLASAAALAHRGLTSFPTISESHGFQVLGTIIESLQKIAASGLGLASNRSTAVADLGMVLDETRVVIDASFRDLDCKVNWTVASGLPLVVADHHSLLQVFLNLARNSQRAIQASENKVLSVEAGVENDMVQVKFRDTGTGVAKPDELFQPFQPGAYSTGLGLYISRAIVRSYGGDVRYEPSSGGSCFVVQLWPANERR